MYQFKAMTLSLNKTILTILLIILLLLLGISGVYGAYQLVFGQVADPLAADYLSELTLLLLGVAVFLVMGILPILFALRIMIRHKKPGQADANHGAL
jgi:hypothetical protein